MNDKETEPGALSAEMPAKVQARRRVIPYPPIEQHGIIGDRRTAALVAADGTLDWLCLPDFDGPVVFGALLDWGQGGYWRLGPGGMLAGQQRYQDESMMLETQWDLDQGTLLLQDAMLWPQSQRSPEQANVRVIVRRLHCLRGTVRCELDLQAGYQFQEPSTAWAEDATGLTLQTPDMPLHFWTNHPPEATAARLHRTFTLEEGQECWAVLEAGATAPWSVESAREALAQTQRYWQQWLEGLRPVGRADLGIRRTAMAVHLLTYAPEGSIVAAPTTSVPERIGGSWNADYRLCWVRDASLAVGILARLGNLQETEQYLQWLVQRLSHFGKPLQVLYTIRGEKRPRQKKLSDVAGYRHSQPVRVGNHAYKQHQLGSYGYLADCMWTYLQEGGPWREEYWKLLRRLAAYTVRHWQDTENGIWELPKRQHYLNSKVLSWVMLDRAIRIARQVKPAFDTAEWQRTRDAIHAEVMARGWSERLGAFRQRYDADELDSASLLMSVMGFLPPDHPRLLATIDRVAELLTINDAVYRFDPLQTPGLGQMPMGELEGAFFPSTFWLATAYAKAGQPGRAEQILERAEKLAGPLALFAEAVDARTNAFLGNTPLLFSHVEYVRAKLEVARVRNDETAERRDHPAQ